MKILIIGSGGREHALAWKFAESEKTDKIYVSPGNGGTAVEEKTENLDLQGRSPESEEGQEMLLDFAKKEQIDLIVAGPESVLAAGIADKFREAGLAFIGPGKKAAALECSKIYSKSFMEKYSVSAPKRRNFNTYSDAMDYVEKYFKKPKNAPDKGATPSGVTPLVIKADGLAAGKGVVITADAAEAKETIGSFMKDGSLGESGKKILFEEYLDGFEVSVLAAVSLMPGKKGFIQSFLPAMDHKSIYEGGMGPNTGGMGAIAPVPQFNPVMQRDFIVNILQPTLRGMEKEKMDYRGFIFFGLMVCREKTYLLEYNVRLGDPETQALMPLMKTDLNDLCMAINEGSLGKFSIEWKDGYVCAPVAVSEGYPGSYRTGDPIAINKDHLKINGSNLFIAGAQRGPGGPLGSGLRTSGGRVLAVSAHGDSEEEAYGKAYEALRLIDFEGMYYRNDIAFMKNEG